MFTNTYSVNPFPCFPSSSYPPLFLNHENSETLLLHDPMAVPFLPSNHTIGSIPQAAINFAVNDSKLSNGNGDHFGLSNFLGRKPVKKDRHSKICTAQGVRDRRVRLSIGIARKFFDLQDMLGFDKASKTLEWLLNKSKKAIKELAKTKQNSSGGVAAKCLSSSSECEVVSGINEGEEFLQGVGACNKPLMLGVDKDSRKLKRTQSEIAKESRAKARARARERTRDKICTRLHDSSTSRRCPAASQIVHHSRSLMHTAEASTDKPSKLVAEIGHYDLQLADAHQVQREKVLEEPVVMKKKPKLSLMSSSGQSLMVSKDERFNHGNFNCNSLFPNFITPNWDVSGATARTSSCAISDVNLSTELQIFAKPWDVYDTQRLN